MAKARVRKAGGGTTRIVGWWNAPVLREPAARFTPETCPNRDRPGWEHTDGVVCHACCDPGLLERDHMDWM